MGESLLDQFDEFLAVDIDTAPIYWITVDKSIPVIFSFDFGIRFSKEST